MGFLYICKERGKKSEKRKAKMAKAVTCASTTSMAKLQFAFSSMPQDASALLLCMCVFFRWVFIIVSHLV